MSFLFGVTAGLSVAILLAILEAPTKLCVFGAVVAAVVVSGTWDR